MLPAPDALTRRGVLKRAAAGAFALATAPAVASRLSQLVVADDVPLRQLADAAGIAIGCELTGGQFDNRTWQTIVGREFNLAIIVWGVNGWGTNEPQRGQFTFKVADRLVAFARRNGMRMRGQALVSTASYANAQWLNGLSADDLAQALRNHVGQVIGHFKGIVQEWTVVNEPYQPPYRQNDPFYTALGYDYIDMAFQAAREADPAATLIYNDSQNHFAKGINTQLTHDIVQRLAAKGLLDAVGLQMHIDASKLPATDDVIATMQSYGLPVCVTEFDVDMQRVSGSRDERFALQAQVYRDMLTAALTSGVCKSFTTWGIGDKDSWWVRDRGEPDAAATLYDDDLNPKPAYYAVRDVLSQAQPAQ